MVTAFAMRNFLKAAVGCLGGQSAVQLAWLNNAMYKGAQCCTGIDLSKEVLAA